MPTSRDSMRRVLSRIGLVFFLIATSTFVKAQGSFRWDVAGRGAFVTAMCRDKSGAFWFGVEDKGVWRFDPRLAPEQRWKQFTTKDGLGDDNGYALACDKQGRIWLGHQSHGVSVYDGRQWRNYDVLSGPLGERVFDIAVSPADGSVWIGTNRGIARYRPLKDDWLYYTRFAGLPSDQVSAITFTSDSTVYIGTQCDGLAVADARDDYKSWEVVDGPERMPNFATGVGLPSRLINDVLAGRDGTIYVATNCGLARSTNKGRSWVYLRGRDWAEKVKGAYPRQRPFAEKEPRDLLLEDHVTTIAEDAGGLIWLGHPSKGVEVRSPGADILGRGGVIKTPQPKKGEAQFAVPNDPSRQLKQEEKTDFVTAILPLPGDAPLVAGYGSGVVQPLGVTSARDEVAFSPPAPAALPSPALPPTKAQLQVLGGQLEKAVSSSSKVPAAFMGEDWKTRGDWMGRYGNRYTVLCAMQSPLDHYVLNDLTYKVRGRLGWHSTPDDSLRHWLHRKQWDDPRVLYNPIVGYRRQADWDDHGEVYPRTHSGPDIWVGVRVPAGVHRIALYFFNKDGHDADNRVRDYVVKIKRGGEDLDAVDLSPTLAQARVRDFWGGVYKQFGVAGPGDYYVKIEKNNTFNTIVQAVLVDKLAGPPTSDEQRRDVWLGDVRYEPPAGDEVALKAQAVLGTIRPEAKAQVAAALSLWNALDKASGQSGAVEFQEVGRLLAYRAVEAEFNATQTGREVLASWRWKFPLWLGDDRQEFQDAMKRGWESLNALNPELKDSPR